MGCDFIWGLALLALPLRRLWLLGSGSGPEGWVNNPAASSNTQAQGQSLRLAAASLASQTLRQRKAPRQKQGLAPARAFGLRLELILSRLGLSACWLGSGQASGAAQAERTRWPGPRPTQAEPRSSPWREGSPGKIKHTRL